MTKLPTVLSKTPLAGNRMALRIAPPTVSPETVIRNFREAGYDVRAYAPVLEGGKVVAVDVICTVHRDGQMRRKFIDSDDDGDKEGEAW